MSHRWLHLTEVLSCACYRVHPNPRNELCYSVCTLCVCLFTYSFAIKYPSVLFKVIFHLTVSANSDLLLMWFQGGWIIERNAQCTVCFGILSYLNRGPWDRGAPQIAALTMFSTCYPRKALLSQVKHTEATKGGKKPLEGWAYHSAGQDRTLYNSSDAGCESTTGVKNTVQQRWCNPNEKKDIHTQKSLIVIIIGLLNGW